MQPCHIDPKSLLAPSDVVEVEVGHYRANYAVKYAEKLISDGINKRQDLLPWGSAIESIRKERKRIEKVKDFFLAPIVAAKKAVESARKDQAAMFDDPIDFLESLDAKLSKPYGDFVLKIRLEDEAKARAEQEAKAKAAEAAAQSDFMADIAKEEVYEEPVKVHTAKTKTMTGSTYTAFIDRVRIVDSDKVPRMFCKPDEALLLEKFKSGEVVEVPGVEFYKKPSTRVR
jgi:hypothetical protein